jgi:class 3 adenylate cyclase
VERDFFTVLDQALARLHSHGRITYNALKLQFHLNDAHLAVLKEELLYTHPEVVDDAGRGLIWTGSLPRVAQTNGRHTEPTDAAVESAKAPSDEVPVFPAAPARPAPEAERRQLTVLFCDLVGSTQLSGQLDPEDLRAVVRAYQEAAAEVIQSYEGHIAQYLGDGLLVYFGYPTAHEDDARRAVHTGLGIVQAIASLNTRLAQTDGGARRAVPLQVRIGVHTGPVVAGVMGGGERHEYLALGETPNLAARLQALAPANAVVISAVTARLVQGTFALEDLGTHALHGVAEPMTLSRVHGLLATPSRDDGFVTAGVPLLVGRDEEVGLLRRRWEQSKAGHGQVVLLSGEAGIGKSALVEALRAQVRAEGLPRMAFRCSPYHTNSTLYPVLTHLERLLQFEPDDASATRLAKLEVGLRPSGLPLAEVVQYIVAKTDGVPLYVEELTKMLLASALLVEEADQYVLTGPLRTVAIPDTLQDALMARLDQPQTAKEVAQLGAVLGREFAYEVLAAIAPQDETPCRRGWPNWWGPSSSTSGGDHRGPGICLNTP